ncbi:MAG: DUF1232 domain-containing protein [Myxococcota bacterium]
MSRRRWKYVLGMALCAAYILNPTAGVFELLPDNLPGVGNLDEAAAMAGLLFCWRRFRETRDGDVAR